jgi:hypothetical protein
MFQSRKMRHDHDAKRKQSTVAQFVDYSLRDLRYVVLWPIWSRHNENLRNAPPTFVRADGSLDTDWYAGSFRQALAEKSHEARGTAHGFAQVFRDASRQGTGDSATRLSAVADAAAELGDTVVDQVATGIEEFCWLIERWHALVEAARSVDDPVACLVRPDPSGTHGRHAPDASRVFRCRDPSWRDMVGGEASPGPSSSCPATRAVARARSTAASTSPSTRATQSS